MDTMRQRIIERISRLLLDSKDYGDYLGEVEKIDPKYPMGAWHKEVFNGIKRMSDAMLLSTYDRLKRGDPFIVCYVSEDGKMADVKVGKMLGGMDHNGIVHT